MRRHLARAILRFANAIDVLAWRIGDFAAWMQRTGRSLRHE